MGNWATIHGPRFGANHNPLAYKAAASENVVRSNRESVADALGRFAESERMGKICRIDEKYYRESFRSL